MNDDTILGDISVQPDEYVYDLDTTGLTPIGNF